MLKIAAVILAALLPGIAPTVEAATFTVTGGSPVALPPTCGYFHHVPNIKPGTEFVANGTLALKNRGKVNFTFLASEPAAGEQHFFNVNGKTVFDTNGDNSKPATFRLDTGILPFGFASPEGSVSVANGGPSTSFGNSIGLLQMGRTSVHAFPNDYHAYKNDTDHDAFLIRMGVAPMPLPAAARLLPGALAASPPPAPEWRPCGARSALTVVRINRPQAWHITEQSKGASTWSVTT